LEMKNFSSLPEKSCWLFQRILIRIKNESRAIEFLFSENTDRNLECNHLIHFQKILIRIKMRVVPSNSFFSQNTDRNIKCNHLIHFQRILIQVKMEIVQSNLMLPPIGYVGFIHHKRLPFYDRCRSLAWSELAWLCPYLT
jgi:hypothetical protein